MERKEEKYRPSKSLAHIDTGNISFEEMLQNDSSVVEISSSDEKKLVSNNDQTKIYKKETYCSYQIPKSVPMSPIKVATGWTFKKVQNLPYISNKYKKKKAQKITAISSASIALPKKNKTLSKGDKFFRDSKIDLTDDVLLYQSDKFEEYADVPLVALSGTFSTNFPSFAKQMDKDSIKIKELIFEFMNTERTYVRHLLILTKLYHDNIDVYNILDKQLLRAIFFDLDIIRDLHTYLLKTLNSIPLSELDLDTLMSSLTELLEGKFSFQLKLSYTYNCALHNYFGDEFKKAIGKKGPLCDMVTKINDFPALNRLKFNDLRACVYQRITKYPLLLSNFTKYYDPLTHIGEKIDICLNNCKAILDSINDGISEYERYNRLLIYDSLLIYSVPEEFRSCEIYEAMVKHPLMSSISTNLLLHESHGYVSPGKKKSTGRDVTVLLLETHVVFLYISDQGKVQLLFSFPGSKEIVIPFIDINKLIVRENASDKKSLYLILNDGKRSSIYNLTFKSTKEKKEFFTLSFEAGERLNNKIHYIPKIKFNELKVEIEDGSISLAKRRYKSSIRQLLICKCDSVVEISYTSEHLTEKSEPVDEEECKFARSADVLMNDSMSSESEQKILAHSSQLKYSQSVVGIKPTQKIELTIQRNESLTLSKATESSVFGSELVSESTEGKKILQDFTNIGSNDSHLFKEHTDIVKKTSDQHRSLSVLRASTSFRQKRSRVSRKQHYITTDSGNDNFESNLIEETMATGLINEESNNMIASAHSLLCDSNIQDVLKENQSNMKEESNTIDTGGALNIQRYKTFSFRNFQKLNNAEMRSRCNSKVESKEISVEEKGVNKKLEELPILKDEEQDQM